MGRHRDEVARELGCSVAALKHRLEYGKELLQKRLTARGVTMTGLMLSLMLMPTSEVAAVPPALAANTRRALLVFARGQQAVAANQEAIHLAGQAINQIFVAHIRKRAISVVLALVLAGSGLGAWQLFTRRTSQANPSAAPPPANEAPVARDTAPVGGRKV